MNRMLILFVACCLFGHAAEAQQPPVLRGQVKHLNGEVAAGISLRLFEPDIGSTTERDGTFRIQLTAGWGVGQQVTLLVTGFEVIRPWDGKLILRQDAAKELEPILIAPTDLANVVRNTAELERILLAASIRDDQPSEVDIFREEARRLNTTLDEFLALFNAWKDHAERGTRYEKALAALYDKKYDEAITLLDEDIAADEKEMAHVDSLRALLPGKYVNKGLAYAGKYEHAEAEAAYKKALEYDATFSTAQVLLADTYRFTGRLTEAMAIYQAEEQRYAARTDSVGVSDKALVLQRIGLVYDTQGKLDSALVYHRQSLEINRKLNRPEGIANQLGNIGNVYKTLGELDSSLVYHRQSLEINRELKSPVGIANQLGNIGLVYETLGELDSSLVYHRQSLVQPGESS